MAECIENKIIGSNFINVLGHIQVDKESILGYTWDDFRNHIFGDSGITISPIINFRSSNDFSNLMADVSDNSVYHFKKGDIDFGTEINAVYRGVLRNSTSSDDINAANRAYCGKLSEEKESFVYALSRTEFDDGMDNYLAEEVKDYIRENAFVTYSWLNQIYSENQKNEDVIAGLLRIIAMDVEKEDYDILLPIVKAGLCDFSSKAQEAAIMVIEKWRTKNCLDALQTANIQTAWIQSYAKKVELELIKELKNAD